MMFKTTATLTCIDCGVVKDFAVEADVIAEHVKDALEIKDWGSSITLNPLQFEGLCPKCKIQ